MTECFHCGDEGHMARDCPQRQPQGGQVVSQKGRGVPAVWCSYCDETSRLVDLGHSVQRCPNCHPLRFAALAHARKCPQCHATVYTWDTGSCDEHAGPGRPLPRPSTAGRPEWTRHPPYEPPP